MKRVTSSWPACPGHPRRPIALLRKQSAPDRKSLGASAKPGHVDGRDKLGDDGNWHVNQDLTPRHRGHFDQSMISLSIFLDSTFGKTQFVLPSSVGFRRSRLAGRARPLSCPVRRTIFWSVTTCGLPAKEYGGDRRADRRSCEPRRFRRRDRGARGRDGKCGVGREMAAQRLENIESAPENGMVSEASDPQDVVHGRADRARLRLPSGLNDKVAEKGA